MTAENLTCLLAERVMRWSLAPDRFLLGHRAWLPRWRFQPTEKIEDAFRLLEEAEPQHFNIIGGADRTFAVRVQIRGVTGEAQGHSKPKVITWAIARAFGIEVDS